ncbi:hypothetical protein NE683_17470 [Bariatricus massiliensis]|uniref:Uncharacterized protein n=1 Tax=Bariatricus massiliensis TaxID=1745713 RepID=A0ABS8DK91_9FIRM|nr:hypothetical protein [Bariatricus massiliensis]MCB7305723.1 hypothetical protein [Bariatricus massiliensis]MCB7376360.1 hypothetical protein [Bariatricus massiliensis]MCB7388866.1 hypothetical protein [Bariatricus massiliensis]MCB7413039.1 hypothetical protein [Bariatricus massiliensis]MCQ5255016.1 hypothetical protein [Bariatricus massiliensis]
MEQKLPYYMMYPTPYLFDDDKIEERDYEYLKSMYPDMAKRILPYVEEECDRMEYDNSMIFDEYPDKLQLRLMCRRIYDNVMSQEEFDELEQQEVEIEETSLKAQVRRRPPKPDRVRDMVELLLYQELLRRRCSHRKCRRIPLW